MRRITIVLLVLYAGLTAYVVARGFLGLRFQPFYTPFLTLLAFSFALLHAAQRFGWGRAGLLLGLTFTVSLVFESVGVATGQVYGPYHYTAQLGPRFLGLVPYLIPVGWFMMMYPSYVIAEYLVPPRWGNWHRRLVLAALAGIVMTAWDLSMDPMMVSAGHWVWEVDGAYFGIPLQNYWGWWLTTFTTFALFSWLGRVDIKTSRGRKPGFDRLALLSYAVTGLSAILTDVLSGLNGPAMVGLFAMGPWVILAWMETARSDEAQLSFA